MENEFDRDYAGEIAIECDKLDNTLFAAMEEYSTSAVSLGKNWYAIGLEDNAEDKESDSKGKRNILLRVIDKIVEFVKMIGKKIAEWFVACKTAIVRFFADEKIDPVEVAARLSLLVHGLAKEDADKIISKLSVENKNFLAEILDKDYNKTFTDMYQHFAQLGEKCANVGKLTPNTTAFFAEFKTLSSELKETAAKGKIYETADEAMLKLLTGSTPVEAIRNVTIIFNRTEMIHKDNTSKLENLLKKIPEDDLSHIEGDNPDAKRQEMVKLIADVIKVNGDIVHKVNNQMQAVAMLMTYVVKYRARKVIFLPV